MCYPDFKCLDAEFFTLEEAIALMPELVAELEQRRGYRFSIEEKRQFVISYLQGLANEFHKPHWEQ
jgi:hypothetical protein